MSQVTVEQAIERAMQIAIQRHEAGQLGEAEAIYRQVLAAQPDHPDALHNLGAIALQVGRADLAVDLLARAVIASPNDADVLNNFTHCLVKLERFDEAERNGRRALQLRPRDAGILNNLGTALKGKGELDQAIACFRSAIAIRPNVVEPINNLGLALQDIGQIDEAIECYQRVLALNPGLVNVHDTLVMALHYDAATDASAQLAASQQWSRQHAEPLAGLIQLHLNDRDANRRLRVGYVSADFRNHAVARFLLPLFAQHDRKAIELFCYSNVIQPDAVTAQLQSHAAAWRNIAGLNDDQAAEQIRQDQIDILVDLAGHTAENRLLLFARQPAPMQVTFLGCPATTGVSAIGYRLTDHFADPTGLTEHHNTETLVRLDPTAWCYCPQENSPAVKDLPAIKNGFVTFGSFNNFAKLNDRLIGMWMRILQAVPHSRLVIKARGLNSAAARQHIKHLVVSHGITDDRVDLIGWIPASDHLPAYGQIDISLDSHPYCGTTTTCESVWMGVPVVTLAGESHLSRVGVSLLSNIGLSELIGHTPEQYIQIAVDLANDEVRLAALRSSLRQRMETSPLMDGPRFARSVETAYRKMWNHWCTTGSAR